MDIFTEIHCPFLTLTINIFFRLYKEERIDGSNSGVKWTCPNIHDLRNILKKVQIDKILMNVCDKRLTNISELPVVQLKDECVKLNLSNKRKKVHISNVYAMIANES